jgi:hypothetical protein
MIFMWIVKRKKYSFLNEFIKVENVLMNNNENQINYYGLLKKTIMMFE